MIFTGGLKGTAVNMEPTGQNFHQSNVSINMQKTKGREGPEALLEMEKSIAKGGSPSDRRGDFL